MAKVDVSYKVKFGDSKDIPLSIARLMDGEDLFVVESCNKYSAWTASPDSISCWIGSSDGDWSSGPDGEDMPIEFIEKWINKWEKNWTN